MIVTIKPDALKGTRPSEYALRFLLGGSATLFAQLVSDHWGPRIGGLFLAMPAIFFASLTLVEKHEIRRKKEAGLDGRRRGPQAAALESAGAAMGSFGLAAFAATVGSSMPSLGVGLSLLLGVVAWGLVSAGVWELRRARHARAREHDEAQAVPADKSPHERE